MGAGNPVAVITDPITKPIADIFTPPSNPPPPADNRPTCDSYKQSGLKDYQLSGFNTAPNCKGTNTLTSWLEEERNNFCKDINNFTKNPGGSAGSCSERNAGQALATTYCRGTDKIKTRACTRTYLGDDIYVQLAVAYCQSTNGQADQWCSCYNVMNNVCDTNPNASGCAEKASNYDVLVEKTPAAFKTAWSGREPCYGLVCQESATGPKYIPANSNQNCAAPIQICGYTINAQDISESTIDARCNFGGSGTGQQYKYDKDGNLIPPKNQTPLAFLPDSVLKYVPLSFDDLKGDDTNKKMGAGASVASSFMSCACVVLLLVLMTSGGGSGGSRFRR